MLASRTGLRETLQRNRFVTFGTSSLAQEGNSCLFPKDVNLVATRRRRYSQPTHPQETVDKKKLFQPELPECAFSISLRGGGQNCKTGLNRGGLYIRAIHHHGMLGDLNTSGITLQVKNFLGHGKGSMLV